MYLTKCLQTVAGYPVAWVSNQFQQYVYDVTDFVVAPVHDDTNVTVAREAAYLYGLNVTPRPDAEKSPTGDVGSMMQVMLKNAHTTCLV